MIYPHFYSQGSLVLSDPQLRSVYDALGEEGLKYAGEVGRKFKSAEEVSAHLVLSFNPFAAFERVARCSDPWCYRLSPKLNVWPVEVGFRGRLRLLTTSSSGWMPVP